MVTPSDSGDLTQPSTPVPGRYLTRKWNFFRRDDSSDDVEGVYDPSNYYEHAARPPEPMSPAVARRVAAYNRTEPEKVKGGERSKGSRLVDPNNKIVKSDHKTAEPENPAPAPGDVPNPASKLLRDPLVSNEARWHGEDNRSPDDLSQLRPLQGLTQGRKIEQLLYQPKGMTQLEVKKEQRKSKKGQADVGTSGEQDAPAPSRISPIPRSRKPTRELSEQHGPFANKKPVYAPSPRGTLRSGGYGPRSYPPEILSKSEKNLAFVEAVRDGDTSRVKHWIDLGVDLSFTRNDGIAALHLACFKGFEDIVDLLVNSGSDINQQHRELGPPLTFAVIKGYVKIVLVLLNLRAKVDLESEQLGNPLHAACATHNSRMVEHLLSFGANPRAERRVSILLARRLRADPEPSSLLDTAFRNEKYTALDLAADQGAFDIVNLLVRYDHKLVTANAFKHALYENHIDIAEYLSDCIVFLADDGVQGDIPDTCLAMLHIAARYGKANLAEKLIDYNFNIDARDDDGSTPLIVAVRHRRTDCVSLLRRRGANIDLVDSSGFSAITLAASKEFQDILDILRVPQREESTISKSTKVFSSNNHTEGNTEGDTSATSFTFDSARGEPKGNDNLDQLTIRTRSSGVTLGLQETEEQQLVTIFVQQLWQTAYRLVGHVAEDVINEENLALLLKTYCNLMRHTVLVSNKFEKGSLDFVQSRRRKIAKRFNTLRRKSSDTSLDSGLSVSDHSEGITAQDISSWLKDIQDADTKLESAVDIGEHISDSSAISELFRALPDMQRFLVENEAWTWFESQLLRICMARPTPARDISIRLRDTGVSLNGSVVSVCFKLDWRPRIYLQEQYPPDMQPDIRNVITITSSEGQVQATTCGAYIHSTWPTMGPPLLQAIRLAIHDRVHETIKLPHNASATVDIDNEYLVVYITAFPEILTDLGELLAWIGAACRASPDETKHSYCTSVPVFVKDPPTAENDAGLLCHIDYVFKPLEPTDASKHDCWIYMLRNVSIADGFLVSTRLNSEPGLEITLPLMILLGETTWADTFNDKFILKGFSTMFVPKQVLPGSVLWHFQRSENDEFMSYRNSESSCIDKSSVSTADISWLHQQRHYIGWTPKAEVHLGTDRDLYSDLDNPDASPPRSGMALETTTISCGYCFDSRQTYSKALCQQPGPAPRNDDYIRHIIHLATTNFVLYDTADLRAWLVDGASTLLHITCCQLRLRNTVRQWDLLDDVVAKYATHEQDPFSVLMDPENRRYIIRKKYDDDVQVAEAQMRLSKASGHTFNDISATDQAHIQNGDIHNTTTNNFNFALSTRQSNWRFEDLVASNYNYLIKAQDHERLNSAKIRFTDRDQLEGWSFLDIVKQSSFLIKPRLVYLQPSGRSWTGYTRTIEAVTLMADGFGDLITPGENVCKHWSTVPKGVDYLATTVGRLICNSGAHGRKKYFPTEIAKEVRWHQPSQLFDSCRCPESECDPVQVILPRLKIHTKRPNVALETYKDGGVIFGKSKEFRMWFPRDAHQSPEMVSKDTVEYSDPEEDVRRQSLDSDFQVPLTEHESTASQSAATTGDLPLETPATSLDQTSTSDITTRQSRINAFSKVPMNPVVASSDQATSHGKLNLGSSPVDYGEELSTSTSAQAPRAQPFTRSKSGILGRFTAFGKRRRK